MKQNKIFLSIIVASMGFLILTSSLSGCTTTGRNTRNTNPNNLTEQNQNYQGQNTGMNPDTINDPNSNPNLLNGTDTNINNQMEFRNDINRIGNNVADNNVGNRPLDSQYRNGMEFSKQKADNIRNQLANMDGIGESDVIVNGNTALIGYTPSDTATNVNDIRNTITNKVPIIDPSIRNVVVSDSADIMTRMRQLSTDITNNLPGNDMRNRFHELIQNINNQVNEVR